MALNPGTVDVSKIPLSVVRAADAGTHWLFESCHIREIVVISSVPEVQTLDHSWLLGRGMSWGRR